VPALRPGLTVVLDHRSVHKVRGVREAIEGAGCRLVYLPPYSPDFNPIEGAWSKAHLRKTAARSAEALFAALGEGLRRITARDARGWAEPCGCHFQTPDPG
jgi:transposase